MRVLVTGGAGRLGVDVCNILLKNGFDVSVFDLDTRASRQNIKRITGGIDYRPGDITQPEQVNASLNGIDAVVHMAALLTVNTLSNREAAERVNIGGTKNIVEAIQKQQRLIPFVYTSSVAVFGPSPDAVNPLDPEGYTPDPRGEYAETKLKAEELIRASGIDYIILRLGSHWQNQIFSRNEFRYMFRIPLANRIEIVHPDDTALAIVNSIKKFDAAKGNTFVITGGPLCRMMHEERIRAIVKILGLPMPPPERFNASPAPMDWYNTEKSQSLLQFQSRIFEDSLRDYQKELSKRFTPFFLPVMRWIIGPIFGRMIVRRI